VIQDEGREEKRYFFLPLIPLESAKDEKTNTGR
jgi:hypothetical protein